MLGYSASASQTTATSNASNVNVGTSADLATLLFLSQGSQANGGYTNNGIYGGITRQGSNSVLPIAIIGGIALLAFILLRK